MNLYAEAGCPIDKAETLLELLQRRAECDGDKLLYRFIEDDDLVSVGLTYKKLDQRARAIASRLQQIGASGEHVVLLYPPGLDFIEGFFGCLYAGAIAVPAYPPRLNRSQLRLNSIIQDVASKFLLGLSSLLSKIDVFSSDLPYLRSMVGVATDLIADGEACNWRRPVVAGSSVAFVQYTSGSTGAPKGVMLSHTNLLCNAALIHHAVEHSASDRYVSWLPM